MLVLARRLNEKIVINGDIVVTVLEVARGQVRLGIEAPRACRILRHELLIEVGAENRSAVGGDDAAAAALGALFGSVAQVGSVRAIEANADEPRRKPA